MAKGRGCAGCRGRRADLENADHGLRAELDAMHARADAADLVAVLVVAALVLITWRLRSLPAAGDG